MISWLLILGLFSLGCSGGGVIPELPNGEGDDDIMATWNQTTLPSVTNFFPYAGQTWSVDLHDSTYGIVIPDEPNPPGNGLAIVLAPNAGLDGSGVWAIGPKAVGTVIGSIDSVYYQGRVKAIGWNAIIGNFEEWMLDMKQAVPAWFPMALHIDVMDPQFTIAQGFNHPHFTYCMGFENTIALQLQYNQLLMDGGGPYPWEPWIGSGMFPGMFTHDREGNAIIMTAENCNHESGNYGVVIWREMGDGNIWLYGGYLPFPLVAPQGLEPRNGNSRSRLPISLPLSQGPGSNILGPGMP